MDLAVKKIELIEWLVRVQDEKIIHDIEELKNHAAKIIYELRVPKNTEELQTKLERSEKDIIAGKTSKQDEVESYFKNKFSK